MFSKIRGLWAIFILGITIPITIFFMYIFPKKHRTTRRIWAKTQSFLLGYNIIQKGNISKKASLILLNHQSLLDIVIIEDLHPGNPCWVAKKEIEKTPLYGHIMHPTKMISIDRKDRRSMVKMIKTAKNRINEGRTIAIFPEGTRGGGKKLLKFENGAKILAEKLDLTVQPAVIVGSRDILDSKKIRSAWGEVRIVFLNPIKPSDSPNWYEETKKQMEKTLFNELEDPPKFW